MKWTTSVAALAGAAFLALASCGKTSDGEACEANDECESGVCSIRGKCGTGECACTGAECGTVRSSCDEGRLCYRSDDPLLRDYTECRLACGADKPCPSGQRCDGRICLEGAESFAITWVTFPRARPCGARVPCAYEVKPSAGIEVDRYVWSFGKETKEPKTTHEWQAVGSYEVSVTAYARTGATARVSGVETLCLPQGAECDRAGAPCCSGTCSINRLCVTPE